MDAQNKMTDKTPQNCQKQIFANGRGFDDFFSQCPSGAQKRLRWKFAKVVQWWQKYDFLTNGAFWIIRLDRHITIVELRTQSRDRVYRVFMTMHHLNLVILATSVVQLSHSVSKTKALAADPAIGLARKLIDDLESGKVELEPVDFLNVDNEKIAESRGGRWRRARCKDLDFYIETGRGYRNGKLVKCNIIVWTGFRPFIEANQITRRVSGDLDFVIQSNEFQTHSEDEMELWIDNFVGQLEADRVEYDIEFLD